MCTINKSAHTKKVWKLIVCTSYVQARIAKTQRNSRCRLCADRDENINRIISEFSKLAQKSIRLDTIEWARWSTGNCARNWNLIIRINGIYTNQNPSQKMRRTNSTGILRYQTDHLILARRPDLIIIIIIIIIIKRTCRIVDLAVPADHRDKLKESEKRDKFQDFTGELRKNCAAWKWRLYQL